MALTTAGVRDESRVCWELHEQARQIIEGTIKDPGFYAVIYALDKGEDWQDEGAPGEWDESIRGWTREPTGWFRANPSLVGNPGGFIEIEKVRRRAAVAKRSPAEENGFRRFRLNQWVSQESRAIQMQDWEACGAPFDEGLLVGRPCYLGLDCSTTRDFTALTMCFDIDGVAYLLWRFWLPEEDIDLREPRDIAAWARRGLIRTTPGRSIDYADIRAEINAIAKDYQVLGIAKDPWNSTQLGIELAEEDGFDVVDMRQGYISISAPCKEFERRILNQTLRHGNNPVAKWMVDCYEVKHDPAGNIKPSKPDTLTSRKRIDGAVSAIMSLDLLTRNQQQGEVDYGTASFA